MISRLGPAKKVPFTVVMLKCEGEVDVLKLVKAVVLLRLKRREGGKEGSAFFAEQVCDSSSRAVNKYVGFIL